VWVGLDVGKEEHFAEVLDTDGERIFARSGGPGAFTQQAAIYSGGAPRTTSYVLIQRGPSPKVLASDGPLTFFSGPWQADWGLGSPAVSVWLIAPCSC
ncbi:MAG TPA: hypothetical protein VNG12_11875, partial [Acidimicrobiales bacterium]|nr:hypothetical protein [Acidimicrobiales bacterium]